MYAEFDDVVRNGPFVSSAKARAEITKLRVEHGLAFTHNPGGGEFYRLAPRGFRCQITMNDDVFDLNTLRDAIADDHTRKS